MTVLPGYFFGDIAYHLELYFGGTSIIDLHENYIKQSQRNHSVIAGPNGLIKLTIPIHKPSNQNRSTSEVKIDHSIDFKREHLNSIRTAYSPSPFFASFFPLIENFYSKELNTLGEIHRHSLKLVSEVLQFEKNWSYSNSYVSSNGLNRDLRDKKQSRSYNLKRYPQVFAAEHEFHSNLSIIDLIFNQGKWARKYLIDNSE